MRVGRVGSPPNSHEVSGIPRSALNPDYNFPNINFSGAQGTQEGLLGWGGTETILAFGNVNFHAKALRC